MSPLSGGRTTNTGALAAAAWLAARELVVSHPNWSVEVALETTPGGALDLAPSGPRFSIEVFAQEWGFALRHDDKLSWIRVTDIPFVHGRDDFKLLRRTPRLDAIARLVRAVELELATVFDRAHPLVRSNIGGEAAIAAWVRTL
jgi:hypothetical protein